MKITANQLKEVNINHLTKTSIENLTKLVVSDDRPKLLWSNNILLSFEKEVSEELVIKATQGIWNIQTFVYAECKQKVNELKHCGISVMVLDYSDFKTYNELIKSILELEAQK